MTALTWDVWNQLTEVRYPRSGDPTVTFKYDPLGRRIEKDDGAGTVRKYTYDGMDILRERTGGRVRFFYGHGPGIDEPLLEFGVFGGHIYYHADGLGSIVKKTNQAGNVVASYQYDAFGNIQIGASDGGYAFTGREWDPETGFYYYRARYYDPQTGRFLSEDPIGFAGGINFYAYVNDNPVNFLDPLGLDEVTDDPSVFECLCRIFKESGYGLREEERAVWLLSQEGQRKCLDWPFSGERRRAQWRAPKPANYIGVAHTHPYSTSPKPSVRGRESDKVAAEQILAPVYTVHRNGIYKIDPTGKITQEEPRNWFKKCDEDQCQ
jgi:RHS repeat-associated protein